MMQTTGRLVRFGLQNYLRNGWLSIGATVVVAMTLFIVSVFTLQTFTIRSATDSVRNKLDMAIYVNDTPKEEEVVAFVQELKAYPEAKEVLYLNKQQVIEEWNKFYVDQQIKNQVNAENNPLPRTIKIKAYDPEQLDTIADRVNKSPFSANIRNMSYRNNRAVIQQLVSQSKQTVRNGIIVSSIFVLIAIVFVFNTIRIIIRFRQDEIMVMKLVGATDSFVRGPFLIEGALYGMAAGILTLVALYFYLQRGLSESTNLIASSTSLGQNPQFDFFQSHIALIALALIGSGVILAMVCSAISVRFHLKH